jgi:flagellin
LTEEVKGSKLTTSSANNDAIFTIAAGDTTNTAKVTFVSYDDEDDIIPGGTASAGVSVAETTAAYTNTVDLKAGETLTSDLTVNAGGLTLSQDMVLTKGSTLASGTNLTANTESNVGHNLSNSVFSNLSDIDVTTLDGAMKAIDTVSAAISNLDAIRSELGSVQNQVVSTINNISVTQVNVKAAESNIRDVDFAAESANFSKFNILAQSGSYAMSQANAVQQNVMRLLQ